MSEVDSDAFDDCESVEEELTFDECGSSGLAWEGWNWPACDGDGTLPS